MTTVQIVGIAVAAAVVALLVIALFVTRRRGGSHEPPDDVSFLDLSPQDTFDGLGRAEEPVEEVTLEPREVRDLRRDRPAEPGPVPPVIPLATSEDATGEIAPAAVAASLVSMPANDAPLRLSWGPGEDRAPMGGAAGLDAREAAAGTAAARSAATAGPDSAAPRPAGDDRRVPLSDLIVTTSRKVVDLDDPEVRRMLKDLVKYELDEATRYREQGQHVDAALHLAEAERISRALGMTGSADAIRQMMSDLQG